jgi:hypothetical protein
MKTEMPSILLIFFLKQTYGLLKFINHHVIPHLTNDVM